MSGFSRELRTPTFLFKSYCTLSARTLKTVKTDNVRRQIIFFLMLKALFNYKLYIYGHSIIWIMYKQLMNNITYKGLLSSVRTLPSLNYTNNEQTSGIGIFTVFAIFIAFI